MVRTLAKAAIIALFLSGLFTASHLMPFNIPALIAFVPLASVFPSLGQTGDAIEIGFAWVEVKQTWVWVALFVYHFLIFFALITSVKAIRWARAGGTVG